MIGCYNENKMQQTDLNIISLFKSRIPERIIPLVKKIIVYGSRARNEPTPDSDLDLAILLERKKPEIEEELEDIAYQVMWDNDFKPIISLKVFDSKVYHSLLSKGFSFYKNIEKEGIVL